MANLYNQNPIFIDSTMAAGWRSLQTMNTGNLQPTNQQLSGAVTREWGIHPQKLVWSGRTVSATNTLVITDAASTPMTLIQLSSIDTANPGDVSYDFENMNVSWKDFRVTTIASGVLYIWYRV